MDDILDKTKKDIDQLAKETSNDIILREDKKLIAGTGVELTPRQLLDMGEIMAYGLLQNLRRAQCIDIATQYLEEQGLSVGKGKTQVSYQRVVRVYNDAKKSLFDRSLYDIQKEKENYVKNLHRIALKAENAMDFKAAISCLKEIATVAGVFSEKEESKIVLNFLPAQPKE